MDTNTDNKLRLFTRGQGKRLKLRGLRRRWLASSVGPIIVILVLVGVLSAATISSSLDARARSSLEPRPSPAPTISAPTAWAATASITAGPPNTSRITA